METPAPPDAAAADPYAPGRAPVVERRRGVAPPGSALVFLWAIAVLGAAGVQDLWTPWVRTVMLDELGLTAASVGLYMSLVALVGVFGLLWAYLSDRVPVLDSRREGYLVIAGVLAAVTWVGAAFVPRSFGAYLAIGLALATTSSVITAVVGGALAEIGRRERRTGRLSAARMGIDSMAGLTGSGLTALSWGVSFGWSAGAGAAGALSIVVLASLALERSPAIADQPLPDRATKVESMTRWLGSRAFWGSLLVVVGGATAHAVELSLKLSAELVLGLSREAFQASGLLTPIGSAIGAAIYWFTCRRSSLRRSLPIAVAVEATAIVLLAGGGGGAGMFPFYRAALGLGGGLATCAQLDLLFRTAPAGREAFGVTLLWGLGLALNVPIGAAGMSGSMLAGADFASIYLAAAAVAALSAAAILIIPRHLVDSPDGGNGAAP